MVIGALVVGSALFPPRPEGESASTAASAEVPVAESPAPVAAPQDGAVAEVPQDVTADVAADGPEGAKTDPVQAEAEVTAPKPEAAPAEPVAAAEAPAAEVEPANPEPALAEPAPEVPVTGTEASAGTEAAIEPEAVAEEVAPTEAEVAEAVGEAVTEADAVAVAEAPVPETAAEAETTEAPPINPGAIAALLENAPPVPPRQLDRGAGVAEAAPAEPEAAPVEQAATETIPADAPETAPAPAELAESAPAEAEVVPLVPLTILPAPTLEAAPLAEASATGPEVAVVETPPEPTPPVAAAEPPTEPAPDTTTVEEAMPETGATPDLPQVVVIEPEPEAAPDPMAVAPPEAPSLPGTQASTMPGSRPNTLPGTTAALLPDTVAEASPPTEAADGVVTNRLPRIGGDTAPDAEVENQAETEPAPEADLRPLARFASEFENLDDKPLMAIVLVDDGSDSLDREMLAALPFPVSIALDPMDPATPERAAVYRSAGKEVVMLATGLAAGAQASDIEVAFQSMAQGLPEAVAVMDLADPAFQDNRPLASLVVPVVQGEGRGLLTWDRGLNAADQVARREGVPAATVFRDITQGAGDKFGMRRLLDRAIFKADQDGRVTVVGDASGELAATLLEWTLEGRNATVALAPLSAVLTTN